MRKYITVVLITISAIALAAITTPYPEIFQLDQIDGAEKERIRLCQTQKKFDKQPTGFYIETGKKIVVNVEILTPAAKNEMPVLTIGTLGFNPNGRNTGTHFTLNEGKNTITNHSGGLIWLAYTTNDPGKPKGSARISFTDESEQVRAPHYVFGTTTDTEFYQMYLAYPTPDVLFSSDYIAVAATREAALQYSVFNTPGNRLQEWMQAIHTLIDEESKISGLDNNDPNPLHHRLKAGGIRFLLVENTFSSPHASSAGYTGYPYGSRLRYLTKIGVPGNNSWMLGHEIGHQHQQGAYMINKAVESTVNIYSYVVERNIQGPGYTRTSATRWQQAQDTYLKLPLSSRIYDMHDDSLRAITGFNHDELRFMVWEQKFMFFGDAFYQNLHRVVREEKKHTGGTAEERRAYLILKASQVSGYDLREFYNLWGIRVNDPQLSTDLNERMELEMANQRILPLPAPAADFVQVTGQNIPEWAKLPLKGITSSAPEFETIDRSDWTITTSYQGSPDATVGGDRPEYIIDNNNQTSFAFVKPGRSFSGITPPADYIPSFTIDMQQTEEFTFVNYAHRSYNNTSTFIRARQISVFGSSDNHNFTPIVENYTIDIEKNENEVMIEFDKVAYKYIKVAIEDWDKISGNTIQVQEFSVGRQNKVSTNINTANKSTLHISPNPVKKGSPFRIQLNESNETGMASIFQLSGQQVYENKSLVGSLEHTLTTPGTYIIRVIHNNKASNQLLIVN